MEKRHVMMPVSMKPTRHYCRSMVAYMLLCHHNHACYSPVIAARLLDLHYIQTRAGRGIGVKGERCMVVLEAEGGVFSFDRVMRGSYSRGV